MFRSKSLLPTLAVSLLVACGGSGGSQTDSNPVTTNAALVSSGAITGFGSVYVNGEHFLTGSTQFSLDDVPGTQGELRVGHEVEVHGHRDGSGNMQADRIEMHTQVRGPVQSIDTAASSLVVLGQTVLVDADTSFDDNITGAALSGLAVTDVVQVSGSRRADGAIQATRIEKRPATIQFKVRGTVSAVDTATHRFNVNALVVDYTTATLQDFAAGAPANGDLVEVKGGTLATDGVFSARIVEKEDARRGEPGEHHELEGPVTRFVSATDFDVAGRKVTTTASTVYENGTAADLALNVKVEVEGAVDASGVLVATKVQFKRRGDARVSAPVESVNATAGTLVLMGIDVTVNSGTRVEDKGDSRVAMFNLSNLAVGDYVEVRGAELPADSNDVVATRLERRRPDSSVRLRGVVDSVTDPGFMILGVNVQTTTATRFDDGATLATLAGKIVSVKGTYASGVLTATEVEFED